MYAPIKPSRNVAIKNRHWYPAALRHAISKKRSLWGRKRRDPNNVMLNAAYRAIDLKCRNLLRDYEIKHEQKVIERNNAGCFNRFVKNKLSCKRGSGALSDNNGSVIVSDAEHADLLNNYFSSVCTVDNGTIPTVERSVPANVEIESIEFTPCKIHAAIKKLKAGGASGPDGFLPLLFKKVAACIAEPLPPNFTSFMSVGKIPSEWSHAIVTPVYKGGSASSVSNYSHISLTCVASKIMERVITFVITILLVNNSMVFCQLDQQLVNYWSRSVTGHWH
jgi:hypothetical protein